MLTGGDPMQRADRRDLLGIEADSIGLVQAFRDFRRFPQRGQKPLLGKPNPLACFFFFYSPWTAP
jgi:hypothetical protein